MYKTPNREILKLPDIINEMDLTDICRTFHAYTTDYPFSAHHRMFSKTDHTFRHKARFNIHKKVEIES